MLHLSSIISKHAEKLRKGKGNIGGRRKKKLQKSKRSRKFVLPFFFHTGEANRHSFFEWHIVVFTTKAHFKFFCLNYQNPNSIVLDFTFRFIAVQIVFQVEKNKESS